MGVSPHTFLCTPQNLLINLKLDQPIRTIRTSKPASKHSHTHTHSRGPVAWPGEGIRRLVAVDHFAGPRRLSHTRHPHPPPWQSHQARPSPLALREESAETL